MSRLIMLSTAAVAAIAAAGLLSINSLSAAPEPGAEIDLSNYRLTFADEFTDLSVSPMGSTTRWVAHTPWNGDFGDAAFTDPSPEFPFTVKDGILSITMKRDSTGRWRSGLLASSNGQGSGFLQSGGYFEMRAKFPAGPGVWPAFWLVSPDQSGRGNPELDIIEYYGVDDSAFMIHVHLWKKGKETFLDSQHIKISPGSFINDFNTFGCDVGPEWTTFYVNRREVWRTKTQPEFLHPVYILANLAAGGGWPIEGMRDPSVMQIDYIRAWQRK